MNRIFRNLLFGVALVAGLASCGSSKSKEPSALIAQSERIAGELSTLVDDSPMFLQSADVEYSDAVLSVAIAFSDTAVSVSDYSESLVQYVLAQYLKAHGGPDLDVVLNTLSSEEGSLKLTLSDTHGTSREYPVAAGRLKQLVKLKPMELNYNDVRTNVSDILAKKCSEYKDAYNATDAEFGIVSSFAQYTLAFPKASAYSNLNQASLTGRYLKVIQPRYEEFGACRPMVEELMTSLSIDGYRFVYTDADGGHELKAALPWRLINK